MRQQQNLPDIWPHQWSVYSWPLCHGTVSILSSGTNERHLLCCSATTSSIYYVYS